ENNIMDIKPIGMNIHKKLAICFSRFDLRSGAVSLTISLMMIGNGSARKLSSANVCRVFLETICRRE
ncbi:hypothetical protein, partial [Komagataeibacter rhaeticus]|uniref:hypothetical protein n=1 Tax=Komagataeibacter rhaeticus TaxID=215221 RepID=UPI0039EC09DB